MRRLLLYSFGVLLFAAVIVLAYGYRAATHVPERYTALLQADPSRQANASTEMFNRSQRLLKQTKKAGKWHAAFTAEQINGYLAVDLEKQFAGLLPGEVHDPRVHVGEKSITLFARYDGATSSVVSLEVEPFLDERRTLALRLVDARAGSLPLPTGRVRAMLSQAAAAADLSVRWVEEDGLPVALVALPTTKQGRQIELTRVELAGDEIRLAGEAVGR